MIAGNQVNPGVSATPATPAVPAPTNPAASFALEPGSVFAQALYRVLSGERVTVIESPPGAGKTTIVAQLVRHIVATSDMSIEVLTPTNAGGALVATRIFEQLKLDDKAPAVAVSKKMSELTKFPEAKSAGARVRVATVASAMMTRRDKDAHTDLVILDEAFQIPLADAIQAVPHALQVLMVGDPGQIGPVITSDTSAWEHLGNRGPHSPAPHFFASRDDAATLTLPVTYRLGVDAAKVVSALYPFPFKSARPDRTIVDAAGVANPEISRVRVADTDAPHDLQTMRAVTGRATSLVGQTLVEADGSSRTLTAKDVAIVVSHNAQVAAVRSLLAGDLTHSLVGEHPITVGTADSLQGSEWAAVVAVDPLIGHADSTPHSQSTGRLCVMLSRHSAHVTWVHGDDWEESLMEVGEQGDDERLLGAQVRTALMSFGEVA